jgi:signal transduction histidine kinase
VTLTALAGGAFLLGRASRRQRDLLGTLQERNAELEVLRREDAARAALTERTRIARELHDVVAHHMTAIVVRAQAAVRVGTARQEDPTATLTWIAETGQESLRATRQAIRMLRTTTGEAVPLAPEPTLRDLEDVARRLRDAGLAVDLHLPDAAPLPDPAVEAAVVRIVTEALTNVLRHAAASRAVVRVVVRPEVVEVLVEDDGTTAPPAGGLPATAGHGLAGMRERALALGGDCSPGRGSLGGWAVTARIPCAAEPAAGGAR